MTHMSRGTVRRKVLRIDARAGGATTDFDLLAAEEPLEVRLDGEALTVTRRTPGHDFELATGFVVAEGIVDDAVRDIRAIRYCVGDEEQQYNVLNVELRTRT